MQILKFEIQRESEATFRSAVFFLFFPKSTRDPSLPGRRWDNSPDRKCTLNDLKCDNLKSLISSLFSGDPTFHRRGSLE